MGTILASASQAAAATTTSAAFQFNPADVVTATIANGATQPNVGGSVTLQLSIDGINYYNVDRRVCGVAPSTTYFETFELSSYVGAQPFGEPTELMLLQSAGGWQWAQLVFGNNDTQAVTIAATDSDVVEVATVTLAGTTSTSGGGIAVWPNLSGGLPSAIIVDRVIVYVVTGSSGAANLSVGFGTSKTTSYTNLIPATSVHTSATTFDSFTTSIIAATAAESGIANLAPLVAAADFITFTGSATTAGLVGEALIQYRKP